MSLFFFSLLALVHAKVVPINVEWTSIYPVSSYIEPGDVVKFYANNPAEAHYVVSIPSNFAGFNFTGPINSGPQPGVFTFNVTLVDDLSQQGFFWADLYNPSIGGFGVIYVRRTNDVKVPWTLFETAPPAASSPPYLLNTIYPYSVTVQVNQRVVWNASAEPYLNHPVYFTDKQFHAVVGGPYGHPLVLNRNAHFFAWFFTIPGRYNYICGVHATMNGTVQVCNGNHCPTTVQVWPNYLDGTGNGNGNGNGHGNGNGNGNGDGDGDDDGSGSGNDD